MYSERLVRSSLSSAVGGFVCVSISDLDSSSEEEDLSKDSFSEEFFSSTTSSSFLQPRLATVFTHSSLPFPPSIPKDKWFSVSLPAIP